MLLALALIVVFYVAAAAMGLDRDKASQFIHGYATSLTNALVGVVLVFVFKAKGWTWGDAGFVRLPKKAWNLIWQIPVACGLTLAVLTALSALLGLEDNNGEQMDELAAGSTPLSLAVSIVGVVVIAPIVEEFVFRRILVGWVSKWVSPIAAVLIVAVVFGVSHLSPYAIVGVTMLGIWSGLATLYYRSLWAGIIMHMANNLLSATALFSALFASLSGSI